MLKNDKWIYLDFSPENMFYPLNKTFWKVTFCKSCFSLNIIFHLQKIFYKKTGFNRTWLNGRLGMDPNHLRVPSYLALSWFWPRRPSAGRPSCRIWRWYRCGIAWSESESILVLFLSSCCCGSVSVRFLYTFLILYFSSCNQVR